MAAKGIFVVV